MHTLHNPQPGQTVRVPRGDRQIVSRGPFNWRIVRKGRPLKGEWYLSGAIIEAWPALADLSNRFWVVAPLENLNRKGA